MSDLNTMYNNGMGSLASLHMGQTQAADREKQALAMQFEQQKMQQAAALHPLEMQQKQATLAQMHAQLPGQVGMSQSLAAKGEVDVATKSGMIAQRFVEMAGKIGDEGMKNLGRDGERALQAAAVLERLPPAMHKQAYAQFVQQYGGDINSPMVKGLLSAPDGEFLSTLQAMGTGMAQATQKFVQDSAHKKAENDSQERMNKLNNDTRIEQERIKAEARANAERLRAAARQQGLSFEKQLTALSAIPETERTPEDWNRMTELKTMMYTKSSLGGNATTPEILGQETPTDRAKRLAQPENRPAPQAAAGNGQNFEAMANNSWGSYEPSKYNYRVNPETGRLQRGLK